MRRLSGAQPCSESQRVPPERSLWSYSWTVRSRCGTRRYRKRNILIAIPGKVDSGVYLPATWGKMKSYCEKSEGIRQSFHWLDPIVIKQGLAGALKGQPVRRWLATMWRGLLHRTALCATCELCEKGT